MIVNISVLKKLATKESMKVKGLANACGKLYGKLALREQFSIASLGDEWGSVEISEIDHAQLAEEIVLAAKKAADLLSRCNKAAIRYGFGACCKGIEECKLSEVIQGVQEYMQALNKNADYTAWIDSFGEDW